MYTVLSSKVEDKYREALIALIDEAHEDLVKAVNRFNSDIATHPINRSDLMNFPLMQWFELNDKVFIRRRKNRFKDYLCFDTKMEADGELGEHFHADIIESVEVISGKMHDSATGLDYFTGDIAHFEKGEIHTPIASEKTLLHILFKP
jgi:hypothetical protein